MREEASGFFAELVERGVKEKVDAKFDVRFCFQRMFLMSNLHSADSIYFVFFLTAVLPVPGKHRYGR